ncbi:hypothetical protein E3T61_17485 [Cryobacterium lactosi]|uniref:DUF1801 domain-containing protein n=1 Tax=Cryobacterium lactosi TaxID=1259202 RepID=A0A4R9BJ10_9MICO|nr:hypothetical protein [Cryobacterium lactosi]TFD85578.1 hypothetical protein E3T61_17485 [Cryobacterium lactosi]
MSTAFNKEEKAAMRAAVAEAKAAKLGADLEAACLAAIDEMTGTDQELAQILHRLVKENTDLGAKTWYGMPAYANADGRVVVFFQSAAKFKVRYATIGFQPDADLDDGNLWPTSFAVVKLTAADQERLVELLKRAVGSA